MTTIAVIYKKEDQLIAGTAVQVIKELKTLGYRISLEGAKFAISIGGDGTILRAARLLASRKTPILGVHMGGLGFCSEVNLPELTAALEQIKKGQYSIDERAMIEANVGGKKVIALNDIVISNSEIARVIKLEIKEIAEYTCDGIVFATATGSTAYNLSAGGPILTPDSASIVISAICPHTITNRSIVLARPITVTLNKGKTTILTADGQQLLPLKEGQAVKIQLSALKTRFIRLPGYDFFKRIKEAFGFGPKF
jgi:NAD+ kinase